ncbi:hypothetical protein [uncultured Microbulbifer sp.]|uniref:hypothetical protein n=1 Tax=uncultured Microbulbifer sp. TaxID=348147 RepID=UPI002604AAC2|nr:hypothetical protein [uncultured Microbulbifer sp.]
MNRISMTKVKVGLSIIFLSIVLGLLVSKDNLHYTNIFTSFFPLFLLFLFASALILPRFHVKYSSKKNEDLVVIFALLIASAVLSRLMLGGVHAITCSPSEISVIVESKGRDCSTFSCHNYVRVRSDDFVSGVARLDAEHLRGIRTVRDGTHVKIKGCLSSVGINLDGFSSN